MLNRLTLAIAAGVPLLSACIAEPRGNPAESMAVAQDAPPPGEPFIVVLGVGQDGGFPQAGTLPGEPWTPALRRYATSLAIVDPASGSRWLLEATPDFRDQLHELDLVAPAGAIPGLSGIFLTHAHIGHYTGLMHLGREVIGATGVPVFAMPRMREFLTDNGPWSQLVSLKNIDLRPLADGVGVQLNERISVTPFLVPHRDEYSETVGFRIQGPNRAVLFLPDIDKWERWDALGTRIEDLVGAVDVAYLDGSFYADGEIPGRNMSEIPHPFIEETMRRFQATDSVTRSRIRFIHLNRTNPVAFPESAERLAVEKAGFRVARRGEIVGLTEPRQR